jgi:hypothetical protein
LRDPAFAEPVEALLSLLSQSKRVFFIGAGCSKCAGLPLMDGLTDEVLNALPVTDPAHAILQGLASHFSGANSCTIEDFMSELADWISLADRRAFRSAPVTSVPVGGAGYDSAQLRDAMASIKRAVAETIGNREVDISKHRLFVRAIHGRMQSGKAGSSPPVDYFTLNYDSLLEDALSLERVPIADGFDGGATGWWNPDAYGDRNAQARVFKLHGSIDWCRIEGDALPRRVRQGLKYEANDEPVMIWPASTKYSEAQRDPYAQIIDMMRNTLRPEVNREAVLVIAGYSFGDEHINFELDKALRESEGTLTILVFTNTDEPTGLAKMWSEDPDVNEHVRIYANKSFHHAGTSIDASADMPWWKFEVLAQLLGGGL